MYLPVFITATTTAARLAAKHHTSHSYGENDSYDRSDLYESYATFDSDYASNRLRTSIIRLVSISIICAILLLGIAGFHLYEEYEASKPSALNEWIGYQAIINVDESNPILDSSENVEYELTSID